MEPESDPLLVRRLMLAKVNATLEAAPKDRESLKQFGADWDILEQLGRKREPPIIERAGN